MSAKKSWDIQPAARRRGPGPSAPVQQTSQRARTPAPVRAVEPVRRVAPQASQPSASSVRRPVRVPKANKQPLAQRRKKAYRARAIALTIVVVALVVIAIAILWRPQLRIQSVEVVGPHEQIVKEIALRELSGTYLRLLPRNSAMVYPEDYIRAAILTEQPSVAAVSMRLSSFTSLSITTTPRVPAFTWCGVDPVTTATPAPTPAPTVATSSDPTAIAASAVQATDSPRCFFADTYGFIFAAEAAQQPEKLPRLYATLANGVPEAPIGGTVSYGSSATNILKFVRAIETLGLDVKHTQIRGDEADIILVNNTRITYVIGREEEAARVAASALPSLSLADGVYAYVDLRFDGKAYAKRRGE